jgi:hypothetical protein
MGSKIVDSKTFKVYLDGFEAQATIIQYKVGLVKIIIAKKWMSNTEFMNDLSFKLFGKYLDKEIHKTCTSFLVDFHTIEEAVDLLRSKGIEATEL